MGEIRYNTETEEYVPSRALSFRGPPYGIVTDFILARGWAKTRRRAEIVLVLMSLACLVIVFLLMSYSEGPEAPIMTPEEAAQMQ